MAELVFHTGPMDCGKSTLALQMDYTQSAHGRKGRLFTRQDRSGRPAVTSRLGLSQEALEVEDEFNFWTFVIRELTTGKRIDYLICDEAQFYHPEHIEQLARIVDELQIDVYAFGILADFRTQLFPGSRRLVELADRTETLPLGPLCWCGQRGTHNARTVGGQMVTEGSQIAVGDTLGLGEIRYEVLCRLHHRRKVTKALAKATLSPDPLPFDNEDWG
ncbi:thymidine kinase [Tessaracoccus sp. OH4464_COT-324]|uniref:thymidine kinase n=1 Tax=Tessaracoccus sp. OH4464_COT-324 TaxID=2491059 RepID=UPI000F62C85D|nr:thymidine kinase [Tessaracoccus sp. OH4464_COT-324]RRD47405.1 thymidine kinase [Tessaracoccus sp. OH4464_COT-324]